jgi:hypothetical protein
MGREAKGRTSITSHAQALGMPEKCQCFKDCQVTLIAECPDLDSKA